MSLLLALIVSIGTFQVSNQVTIVEGFVNKKNQVLIPIQLNAEDEMCLLTFDGSVVGRCIKRSPNGFIVFEISPKNLDEKLLLKAKNREFLVKLKLPSSDAGFMSQLIEKLIIAGSAIAGFLLRGIFEGRKNRRAFNNFLKMHLDTIASEILAGGNVRTCLSQERLFPSDKINPNLMSQELYLSLMSLSADVAALGASETNEKRDEIVNRFFGVVKGYSSVELPPGRI